MTTGVVVVAWNGQQYLRDCLRSVVAQTARPQELVVVDNASEDGSLDAVRAFQSEAARLDVAVRVMCQSRNVGFTRGANIGIDALMSPRPQVDCVVLLNQDATLESNWCEVMSRTLLADATIGVVGCKIFSPNRVTIQHAGGYIERPRLVGRHFGHHNPDDPPIPQPPRDVEFVTAAAMALRVEALVKVGTFQEVFSPGYYEDVDLCTRMRDHDWRVAYCPEAVAVHAESTSFADRVQRLGVSNRSRLIYALRWLGEPQFRAEFLAAERQHIAGSLPNDERRALGFAYLELLLMLSSVIKVRMPREFDSSSVVSELLHAFASLRDDCVASWN
jgi:GT2 family glycosyltransferase